jgi:hypothetical protein
MSGHQVTYKSEKVSGKMVLYEGTDTLYEGYALCYNVDATPSDSDPVPSAYRVEKPSATNLEHFAGLVSQEYAGRTGPCEIRVIEPDKMQKANAYIGINTVQDVTLLCLTPAQYYLGGVGASHIVVGRAMATDATLTGTPGVGLVKMNATNDKLARAKVGSSTAYQSTGEAGVKFWEMRTASSDATGDDSRGLYWWHKMTGLLASGEAGRFMTITEGATTGAIHGVHNSISCGATAGAITGQGAANRATVMVPDRAMGTGAISGLISEFFCEGDASSLAGGSKSFLHCNILGDATGVTTLQNQILFADLDGCVVGGAGDGNVVDALAGDVAATHVVHIQVSGVDYYLLARNAVT